MTDKLKTFEFRCRGRIKAGSEDEAKIALDVSAIVMTAKSDEHRRVHILLDNIEVLGEVEGE